MKTTGSYAVSSGLAALRAVGKKGQLRWTMYEYGLGAVFKVVQGERLERMMDKNALGHIDAIPIFECSFLASHCT